MKEEENRIFKTIKENLLDKFKYKDKKTLVRITKDAAELIVQMNENNISLSQLDEEFNKRIRKYKVKEENMLEFIGYAETLRCLLYSVHSTLNPPSYIF
jgi:hypothetical protein